MAIATLLAVLFVINPAAFEQLSIVNYATQVAQAHKIDENMFLSLISCESRFNTTAKGDYRKETGKHMAYGPLQWWRSSFNSYSKKYNLELDYHNSYDQIDLAALVIRDGGLHNWKNCQKHIGWK